MRRGVGSRPRPPDRPRTVTIQPWRNARELRTVQAGAVIHGADLYVVYGTRRVNGYQFFCDRDDNMLYVGWCFGFGLAHNLTSQKINGELLTALSGYQGGSHQFVLGSSTQTALPLLSAFRSDYDEEYPGLILSCARFNTTKMDSPSTFDSTAIIAGRKFSYDGGSVLRSANNVKVAYDILTAEWPWPGLYDTSQIDISSFDDYADYCDESVAVYGGGTENRHEYHGMIMEKDPLAAAAEVLGEAHLHLIDVGGKVYIGADDDSAAVTEFIPESRWYKPPSVVEAGPETVTTKVVASYTASVDESERHVTAYSGATGPEVVERFALNGKRTAAQALRWAEQYLKIRNEKMHVTGVLGPEVADYIPYDKLGITVPFGLGEKTLRIVSVNKSLEKGEYIVSGRLIDGDVESSSTEEEDAAVSVNGGWETGTPSAPLNLDVDLRTRMSNRDVAECIINLEWDAPAGGPRVRHYNIKIKVGSTGTEYIMGKTSSRRWHGKTTEVNDDTYIGVYAVGYDGTESSVLSSGSVDTERGYVTGLLGDKITERPSSPGAGYYYDTADNSWYPMIMKHLVFWELGSIADGSVNSGVQTFNTRGAIVSVVACSHNDASPIALGTTWGTSTYVVSRIGNFGTKNYVVCIIVDFTEDALDLDPGGGVPDE